MLEEYEWCQKYRPRTIDACILPDRIKDEFKDCLRDGNIQNMILVGKGGVGKTTVARALTEELKADTLFINGSTNGNIDTLRNDITTFASSVSFSGGRKYVILDEADGLTQATQGGLRGLQEEFSKNCGFILTCNYLSKLIEPLHSRTAIYDFRITKSERADMMLAFLERAGEILAKEQVTFDPKAVASLIAKFFPDFRRTLNELQRYGKGGHIDTGILTDLKEGEIKKLVDYIRDRKYTDARRWIGENSDIDSPALHRTLYDILGEVLSLDSIPQMVVTVAKYQYQSAFVADQSINNAALIAELMSECSFKSSKAS